MGNFFSCCGEEDFYTRNITSPYLIYTGEDDFPKNEEGDSFVVNILKVDK